MIIYRFLLWTILGVAAEEARDNALPDNPPTVTVDLVNDVLTVPVGKNTVRLRRHIHVTSGEQSEVLSSPGNRSNTPYRVVFNATPAGALAGESPEHVGVVHDATTGRETGRVFHREQTWGMLGIIQHRKVYLKSAADGVYLVSIEVRPQTE